MPMLGETEDSERAGAAPPEGGAAARSGETVIDTVALMRGRRAIAISHHGEVYRLRITSRDKLILTK